MQDNTSRKGRKTINLKNREINPRALRARYIKDRLVNVKKIRNCSFPHDFQDATPEKTFGKRYVCTKCGGMVKKTEMIYYNLGLKHGAKSNGLRKTKDPDRSTVDPRRIE